MEPGSILESVWRAPLRTSKFRGFSFALDLKSEFKKGFNNVLSILLGKLVGPGSIEISRTVLPGWDPE